MRPAEERVDHVTENMQASIQNMLIRIESELDAADSTIGQKLHLLVCLMPWSQTKILPSFLAKRRKLQKT